MVRLKAQVTQERLMKGLDDKGEQIYIPITEENKNL
jgi:hypothetical protein